MIGGVPLHLRPPQMRVSDAERHEIADILSKHFADGRLDDVEFNERLDKAMRAKTRGDLAGLLERSSTARRATARHTQHVIEDDHYHRWWHIGVLAAARPRHREPRLMLIPATTSPGSSWSCSSSLAVGRRRRGWGDHVGSSST